MVPASVSRLSLAAGVHHALYARQNGMIGRFFRSLKKHVSGNRRPRRLRKPDASPDTGLSGRSMGTHAAPLATRTPSNIVIIDQPSRLLPTVIQFGIQYPEVGNVFA